MYLLLPLFHSSSDCLPLTVDRTRAVHSFKRHRENMQNLMSSHCISQLANRLRAEYIITEEVRSNACHASRTSVERSRVLLDCMESKIEGDPSCFKKIIRIMKSEDLGFKSVAEALLEKYCELSSFCSLGVCVVMVPMHMALTVYSAPPCDPQSHNPWPLSGMLCYTRSPV